MVKKNFSRLKKNYPLLLSLKNSSAEQRKFILKKASPDLIQTIADICYNIVRGNIDLPENKQKALRKHKRAIRRLADKKIKIITKRREILQKGGFLPALLPALSIAASIIGGILAK